MADAHEVALRALRHRDLSVGELRQRLVARGFSEAECGATLARLERAGLLGDGRFAEQLALALAARGASDALIRHRLEAAGVAGELIDSALEGLEPELERARRIVEQRGPSPRTARYLAGKGFSEEAVGRAVAVQHADEIG